MAIEKKSLIDTRAAAKKAVVASKTAAPVTAAHNVLAPRQSVRAMRAKRALRAVRGTK